MRRKIIAGNWKMNKNQCETSELIGQLKPLVENADADVVFCVPSVNLEFAVNMLKDGNISVGAQNMYYEDSGAYTGEISASMLTNIGVKYVIIGHSERRAYFGETDSDVNKKVLKALENSLIPIICVGETLTQREQGITTDLVRMQTRIALINVDAGKAKDVIIAYEPVWAIGTGKTATKEQAQEVCHNIRVLISELYGADIAEKVRIQYGGSVSADNAAELFSMPDIDGGLVGSASLKLDFAKIVNYKS